MSSLLKLPRWGDGGGRVERAAYHEQKQRSDGDGGFSSPNRASSRFGKVNEVFFGEKFGHSVDRTFTHRLSTQSVTSNGSSVASSSRTTLSRALSTASSMVGQGSSMLSREFESHHRKKRPYNSKSRRLNMATPESKKDVKRKKRLSPDSIFNDKMSFCCDMECMRKIPLETFTAWREEYVPYSQNRLNEKLMDVIKIGRADLKVRKKFFILFLRNGVLVRLRLAWCTVCPSGILEILPNSFQLA